MQLTGRPSATIGVVLAGASLVAATPAAAPPRVDAQVPAVQLTAGSDLITSFEDVFKLAQTNLAAIYDHFAPAPFPTLQQIIDNPASFDLQEAANAAVTPFLPTGPGGAGTPPAFLYPSLSPGFHVLGYHAIDSMLTSDIDKALLAFTASPLSSVLLGDLGPILDPWLALQDSIQNALHAPDLTSALNDLINIPANIADATLNGQFLDGTTPELNLTPLLSLLPAGTLPSTIDIQSLDLALGGLLSPGGSLFNAIGVDLTKPFTIDIPGVAVGPIASHIELDQAIAAALGFDFNALSGTVDPLSGLSTELDTLATDLLGHLATLF
jgi:hypothetical protein